MKFLFTALVAFGLLTPTFAQASNDQALLDHSCRAREIEKFYCPVSQDWWNGPFYDAGCSVKCAEGQTATCIDATCDNGEAVASSCSCN